MPDHDDRILVGSVVQITQVDGPDRLGWLGAFVLVTEVKSWGIQGFVHVVEAHDTPSRAFIRLPWDQITWIGESVLTPDEEAPDA